MLTLSRIFDALFGQLVVALVLKEPSIMQKQAPQVAQKHIVYYLKRTMNVEQQEPDNQLVAGLVRDVL